MAAAIVALTFAALLLAPHLLKQERLTPVSGVGVWMATLVLRAALAVSLVVILVLFLPATQLFTLLTHWCLHTVVPFIATHLGFDGHALGDAAIIVPAVIMAASLLSVGFGLWRGTRAVRGWLHRSSLGAGPGSSVIIEGSEIVVAAAGLRDPRVVVSAGALVQLDDDELAAGLAHEWGHVERRHRFVLLVGELCRAVSRLLPGGRRALAMLRFHLERDADDYAVSRTGDPLALASAICKAATASVEPRGVGLATLGGSGSVQRLRLLADEHPPPSSRLLTRLARSIAAVMAAAVMVLGASTPALASAGIDQLRSAPPDSLACD